MKKFYRKILIIAVAPFYIVVWCIMNPRKVWEQAKKDLKIKELKDE